MKFEVGKIFYHPDDFEIVKITHVRHFGNFVTNNLFGIEADVLWKYHGDKMSGELRQADVPSDWSNALEPCDKWKSVIFARIFE
jgi:hypothetical protein